ncbi:hypothetical protein FSP39_019891 [Pinctada imbricata]|uniref:Death domain-containing protein n=1 Tax=Pinctada imbricata TaxID=66713 RepID=A0AA89C742_PINIB|nr:hypothetical protein FSP39_019891 [Pinctada imbricata]
MKFNLTIGKDMAILGHAMGFVTTEIDHIIMESHYSVATQMHKLFTKWRQRYSRGATLGLLTATLKRAESYGADVNWDKYDDALKDLKKSLSMD